MKSTGRKKRGIAARGTIILAVLVLAVFVIILMGFIPSPPKNGEKPPVAENNSFCGDGMCNPGENCYDCPKDCECEEGTFCSQEDKSCIEPKCGNGECEPFEDPQNCCLDCECTIPGEFCNEETKSCEEKEFALKDDEVESFARAYYEGNGSTIQYIEVYGLQEYNGELIKVVRVKIDDEGWFRAVGVTEIGEVIELPVYGSANY